MNPLPDRVVVVGLIATVAVVFALVFWSVRLSPGGEPPLQWRDTPAVHSVPHGTRPILA